MNIRYFALITVATAAWIGHAQKIAFEPKSFSFGEMYAVAPVTRDVTVTNIGDAELKITKMQGSCGCTTARISEKTLQPAETATMTVKFNPVGRIGKKSQRIFVTSNDVRNGRQSITFDATVKPVIEAQPSVIEFKMNDERDGYLSTEVHFDILNVGDKPFTINRASCNGGKVTVEFDEPKDIAPGDKLTVATVVKPTFIPEKPYTNPIYISGTYEEHKIYSKVTVKIDPSPSSNAP